VRKTASVLVFGRSYLVRDLSLAQMTLPDLDFGLPINGFPIPDLAAG
jgi:hypothetical protein